MPFVNPDKDIIDILAGLSPFFIGVLVIWIASRQAKIMEKQRKQGYLDRYFFVYQNLTKAVDEVGAYGRVTDTAQKLFWKARDEARLFLDDEIFKYTEEILQIAHKSYLLNIKLENIPKGKERTKKVRKMSKLNEFLYDLEPHKKFQKFMKID